MHSIDIGNEGSAFIEVLVGHSTSVKDQDYEVHLSLILSLSLSLPHIAVLFISPLDDENKSYRKQEVHLYWFVEFFSLWSCNQFLDI